jgi:hypothetical protein
MRAKEPVLVAPLDPEICLDQSGWSLFFTAPAPLKFVERIKLSQFYPFVLQASIRLDLYDPSEHIPLGAVT